MSTVQRRVEAVLSARDAGYTRAMERAVGVAKTMSKSAEGATKDTKTFTQSMLGMASGIGLTKLVAKGFDLIRNSVGSAMDRGDSIDNFNRTITLMSGSALVAKNSLADLTGQSRGTAYGLDTVAKSTQGLTTSGIEIKKSTRYIGGWMDAVSTFGDGTNATLGNVTYQLSQMAAKGKANLGDLKSAMEAGIPVIKMYAEATGQSTEEVSKAISNGEISAEHFMEVMDKAFRQGTKSFASIEGAAKRAGGTWRGTFDNMRAATTRGVLSIINSIEKARAEANLPGMKDSVASFGSFTERSLNVVAKVAGFTAKHLGTLATATLAAAGAYSAFKTVEFAKLKLDAFSQATTVAQRVSKFFHNTQGEGTVISNAYANALNTVIGKKRIEQAADKLGIALTKQNINGKVMEVALTDKQKTAILAEVGALSLKNIIVAAITGKIKLTTAAQLAWNAAIAANPVGAIIVGVTLLVTGLKKLNDVLTKTSKEHKKANEEAKAMADTNNQLADSSKDLKKSLEMSRGEAAQNASEARRLVNQLKNLESQSGNTERRQREMSLTVAELNKKYPDLNVQLDKTGTAIKGSTDAIYAQIDAMEKAAKAEAMREHLAELYKKQLELKLSVEATRDKMREMEEAGTDTQAALFGATTKTSEGYKELQESLKSTEDAWFGTNEEINKATELLEINNLAQFEAQEAAKEQAKSLENLNEAYGVTSDQIVKYSERTGEELGKAGDAVVELSEKYGMSTDEIVARVEAQNVTIDQFAKNHEEDLKRAEEAFKSYVESSTTGLDELEQKSSISLEKYMENMRKNTEATSMWSENVNKLMQAGVSEGMIRELEKLGPSGAAQAAAWVAELEELNGGTLGKFGELNEGAREKINELESVFTEGLEAATSAAETSYKAHDYASLGKHGPDEIAKGIVLGIPSIEKESKKAGEAIQKGVDEGSKSLNIKVATKNMEQSFGGLRQTVQGETKTIVDTTLSSFKEMEAGTKRSVDGIKQSISNSFNSMNQDTSAKVKAVTKEVKETYTSLSGDIKQQLDKAKSSSSQAWSNIAQETSAKSKQVVQSNKEMSSGIKGAFNPLPGQMRSAGHNAGMGLYYGLQSTSGSIYGLADNIAYNVAAKIRRALAIRSPSRVMQKLGLNTGEGFALGIEKSMADINRVTDRMSAAVMGVNHGLDAMHTEVSGQIQTSAVPAFINLVLGGKHYRAYVEDITNTQNASVELELAYGV